MKILHKQIILSLSALTLATSLLQSAQASSAYTGSADLTISITGINNQSNPSSGYGNDILYSGLTELDSFSDSTISGIGSVNPSFSSEPLPSDSNPFPFPTTFNFTHAMLIKGNVSDGNIDSYYLNTTNITLENTSSDTYIINYTVNYNLSVTTSGEYAEGTSSITGDNLGLPDDGIGGYIEVGSFSDSFSESDIHHLSLVLEGGHIAELYSEFEFSGYAESSPVPLPSAVWLFLAGLLALPRSQKL